MPRILGTYQQDAAVLLDLQDKVQLPESALSDILAGIYFGLFDILKRIHTAGVDKIHVNDIYFELIGYGVASFVVRHNAGEDVGYTLINQVWGTIDKLWNEKKARVQNVSAAIRDIAEDTAEKKDEIRALVGVPWVIGELIVPLYKFYCSDLRAAYLLFVVTAISCGLTLYVMHELSSHILRTSNIIQTIDEL